MPPKIKSRDLTSIKKKKRPEWDDSINNLSRYKLSKEEQQLKKQQVISSNRGIAKQLIKEKKKQNTGKNENQSDSQYKDNSDVTNNLNESVAKNSQEIQEKYFSRQAIDGIVSQMLEKNQETENDKVDCELMLFNNDTKPLDLDMDSFDKCKEMENRLEELQMQLQIKESRIDHLEEELLNMRDEKQSLNNQLEQNEKEKNAFQTKLQEKEQQIDQLLESQNKLDTEQNNSIDTQSVGTSTEDNLSNHQLTPKKEDQETKKKSHKLKQKPMLVFDAARSQNSPSTTEKKYGDTTVITNNHVKIPAAEGNSTCGSDHTLPRPTSLPSRYPSPYIERRQLCSRSYMSGN
eukprot:gb/GECH01009523.1/.p1 GENE.gb/GECH01009523.1/~~gb/GECH01009523.1/.p1  ORF type:complete len:347 (+),score=90.57 gb/GECH01009523.1/:1-1041(+)